MADRADELDSDLAAVVADVEAMGLPEWHELSVASARRLEDELFTTGGGPEMARVRDLAFDGPAGEIPVRVYRPDAPENALPTLVFYHGGGWTLGTLDSAGNICRELAARAGRLVVSVDYRLAPADPFPAAVDDAYAALEWTARTAGALGGDPDRLAVAGTSAGGNLAAAVALRARAFAGPGIERQALLYPILDRAFDTDSYRENAGGPLLTRADMEWFWDQYLRSPVDAHNPFAAPLRAADLEGLPPATVVTAGFDPLRDEGRAYADRLRGAGVAVEGLHYPAMCHGFLSLTGEVPAADEAMDAVAAALE